MGRRQSNASPHPSPSRPRFPPRTCHRRGCGRVFTPRSWNQRYCRESHCLRLLHRWQATKRQRARRRQAEKRQQHADAERERRRRQREAQASPPGEAPPVRLVASARVAPRAWSRSPEILPDFCDRPGCYDPLPGPRRGPAQYCGADCAQAQRRVHDRERKFQARQQETPQRQTQAGDQAGPATAPRTISPEEWGRYLEALKRSSARVRTPSPPDDVALSSRDRTELLGLSEEVSQHDPKTSAGRRPRAPPTW